MKKIFIYLFVIFIIAFIFGLYCQNVESTKMTTPYETYFPTDKPTKTSTSTPKPTKTSTSTPKPTKTSTSTPKSTKTSTSTPKPTKTSTSTPKPTKITSSKLDIVTARNLLQKNYKEGTIKISKNKTLLITPKNKNFTNGLLLAKLGDQESIDSWNNLVLQCKNFSKECQKDISIIVVNPANIENYLLWILNGEAVYNDLEM